MLIAEDLLLLAYDDEKGKPVGVISHLEHSLAGALLVELALLDRVDVTEEGDERYSQRNIRIANQLKAAVQTTITSRPWSTPRQVMP